ncbi:uncharacterized protein EAE98_011053 [Botrytis deweyae]|uniref:Ubiquitin-like domain-containing protein n=1 Tax=Botrytis deweyae TaxID=2478750 RepID=A0ABQ7I770_9HELO|nr:uncharacterized protein EAE98_011053 [Botrytis deweyae]KAF7915710.1 hypothetical protein EAE98_011053 [Botrytis deweyae]
MDNLVEADNRFKVELREPRIDTTGFKQICISNVEGDFLNISFRRTLRVPESGNRLKVPPDFGPFPIYPFDKYKDKFDHSVSTNDGVFIPIYQREAMWIHFESTGYFAVKVIIDGVNAISGESNKGCLSADLRSIALLYEKKSIQDYIVAGNSGQRWLDGVKTKEDKIMQFFAAPNQIMAPSTKSSINLTDGIRRIQFEIVPQKLDTTKRMPITVRTLSGKVFHINVSNICLVNDLMNKILGVTSIPWEEQRINFADQQLEPHRRLRFYGIKAGSEIFLTFGVGRRPRSHAAQKHMCQTTAGKRLLEYHAAIKESYGEKRDVIFADANTNIVQDIEVDDFNAKSWDTDNTLIFNLQMINTPASEIVLGMKPPQCPIPMAMYKEHNRQIHNIHDNDEEGNDGNQDEDEDEDDHKVFKVTTDQSGARGSFAPVDDMKARLGEIFELPDDDDI